MDLVTFLIFQLLHSRISSHESLSLSNLVIFKACCHIHASEDEVIYNLHCEYNMTELICMSSASLLVLSGFNAMCNHSDYILLGLGAGVALETSILATPICSVPIIPTALARNLSGPLRLSELQGTPKCG